MGARGAGKSALKKIPGVGAIMGLAFGAKRFMDGDITGSTQHDGADRFMAWYYLELPGLGNLAWPGALHTQSLGGFSQDSLACPSTRFVFEPRVKGGECSADLPLRYYRVGLVRLAGNWFVYDRPRSRVWDVNQW